MAPHDSTSFFPSSVFTSRLGTQRTGRMGHQVPGAGQDGTAGEDGTPRTLLTSAGPGLPCSPPAPRACYGHGESEGLASPGGTAPTASSLGSRTACCEASSPPGSCGEKGSSAHCPPLGSPPRALSPEDMGTAQQRGRLAPSPLQGGHRIHGDVAVDADDKGVWQDGVFVLGRAGAVPGGTPGPAAPQPLPQVLPPALPAQLELILVHHHHLVGCGDGTTLTGLPGTPAPPHPGNSLPHTPGGASAPGFGAQPRGGDTRPHHPPVEGTTPPSTYCSPPWACSTPRTSPPRTGGPGRFCLGRGEGAQGRGPGWQHRPGRVRSLTGGREPAPCPAFTAPVEWCRGPGVMGIPGVRAQAEHGPTAPTRGGNRRALSPRRREAPTRGPRPVHPLPRQCPGEQPHWPEDTSSSPAPRTAPRPGTR